MPTAHHHKRAGETMSQLKQTETVREELNRLLAMQERTRDAQVNELLIGSRYVLVTLSRPVVIDGECRDTDDTIDLIDLMSWHERDRQ